jgi:hypothetical protein
MAYYNEFFIEKDGKLIHIGSCTGSDTPCYFNKVTSLNTFNNQLKKLEKENGFWKHSEKHPFPWSTYKTSDYLIVLLKNNRKWFEFWKPTHKVFVSADKYDVKDNNKCNFISIDKWFGDADYDKKDLITFDLPILKKM